MSFNFLKSMSTAALLARILSALAKLARAQERLAAATEKLVQIEALKHNIRPSKLQEAIDEAEKDSPFELLEQTPEELNRLAYLERLAEERGIRIPEDADMEELLFPGGDGMDRARARQERRRADGFTDDGE